MKLPTSSDPFLTVNECCLRLGLFYKRNGKTVYLRTVIDNALRSGRLPSYVISSGKRKKKHLINPRDLARFLEENRFKPSRRRVTHG